MAETLTRTKRSRRTKAADPRERELKRLKLSVCDDTGFRLLLATYDQPKRRDELIARVVAEGKTEKVRVTRLDLAEAGPEANLVGLLRAHITSTKLSTGWRQAVMVIGIEQRLDYAGGPEGYAFLHQANLLRDALPEAAPVPVVLWLSRMASAALPAEAPDLWHWRAANFDFTGDKAPRLELLRELTTRWQEEDGGGLSIEQRQARAQMLEDLVAELECQGPPKSKRQAAERAQLLDQVGQTYISLDRPREALTTAERQVEITRKIGDRALMSRALVSLGFAHQALGGPRRGIEYYDTALVIARELGNRALEGGALSALGGAYRVLGEPLRASEHHEAALEVARELGNRSLEIAELSSLGNVFGDLGEPRREIECYEAALQIARETSDRTRECWMLTFLGDAYREVGKQVRAIECHEEALEIARELGNSALESDQLSFLGHVYVDLGEWQQAIALYEQALMIARKTGDRPREGWKLHSLGTVYDHLGEHQRAMEHFEQALEIARECGDREGEGRALSALGAAYRDLGDSRRAIELLRQALAIQEEIGRGDLANQIRAQLTDWDADRAK